MDWKSLGRKLVWRVDDSATHAGLTSDEAAVPGRPPGHGCVVYIDEDGRRRRLPADLAELTAEQRDAAITALSQGLGAAPPDAARMAAIERLTEIRASGRISEEQYSRERRRLERYD